jgi:g-D-glutamyl-meso-diaminopimelate peptidase
MMRELETLAEHYPGLVGLSGIGHTVSGTEIPLVTLGKGATKVLVLGAEHAREFVGTSFIMRTIDTYANAYARGARIEGEDVRAVLDRVTFYLVPMVNIDGVALVTGTATSSQVRVAKLAVGAGVFAEHRRDWKANVRGVDLNRNYPVNWRRADSADGPAPEGYKGESAASEPEVQAVVALAKAHDFAFLLAVHTKGDVIYWRDAYNGRIPGDRALARKVEAVNGFDLVPVDTTPGARRRATGASAAWFRHTFNRPAVTIEFTPMSEAYASAPRHFNRLIWKKNKALLLKIV